MSDKLLGQVRHLLTGAGGGAAGAGVMADSLEAMIGGIIVALIGHLFSWLSKSKQSA